MASPTPSPHLSRLLNGKGQIFAHDGTSQYSQGSPSGCGLAAFNCTRILFEWDRYNISTDEIFDRIALRDTAMDAVSLCATAKIPQHMEPDDYIALPLFQASLTLVNTEYCAPQADRIQHVLQRLSEFDFDPAGQRRRMCAVVLTRPPEIVVCFKIPHSVKDIYALYDSHSRPRHPMGSAFVCTPDMKQLGRYIHQLLHVDESLLNGNSDIGWEGQLLSSMSGHYFVPAEIDFALTPRALQILIDATVKQLSLEAAAKEHGDEVRSRVQRAEQDLNERFTRSQNELEAMRIQMEDMRREITSLRSAASRGPVAQYAVFDHHPHHSHHYQQPNRRTPPRYQPGRDRLPTTELYEDADDESALEVQQQIEAEIASRNHTGRQGGGGSHRMERDHGGHYHQNGPYERDLQQTVVLSLAGSRNAPITSHYGREQTPSREERMRYPGDWGDNRPRSQASAFDMSDIGRETLEMQRMAEFEAQQRRQQSQRSPSPARQNTLDLEERFRRAEENERRRLGQSGPSPVTAGRYQRAEDNERRTMAGGLERQSTRQPLNRSNARPLDIQERYQSPEELERQRAEEARQADAEAAALLARQFEEEDARIQREHSELMSSAQKTFECSICMDEHVEEDLAAVDMCGHKFGRECLRDFIASKVDQRSYPIVCPICIAEQNRDGGRDRIGTISNNLAEMVGLPEDKYTLFVESQLASLAVQITCKKCEKQFFFDRDQFQEENVVECLLPNCDYRWCKMCSQEVPRGQGLAGEPEHSCDGSKELDRLLEGQGWKRCPGCQTPIERTHGCNHMTCQTPGCNMHFCYKCGSIIGRADPGVDINPAYRRHYESCPLFN